MTLQQRFVVDASAIVAVIVGVVLFFVVSEFCVLPFKTTCQVLLSVLLPLLTKALPRDHNGVRCLFVFC